MRKIVLYGELGRRFGKYWHLDVTTPAEALRAIAANRRDFVPFLTDWAHKDLGFKVFCGRDLSTAERLTYPFAEKEVIRIVPVVAGAGDGKSLLTIGIGIFLMFVPGGQGVGATFLGMSSATVAAVGASLVISGVASLLAPTPKSVQPEQRPENKPSFIFTGAVNTILQGGCVPVCYGGPIEVGSYVISASMDSRDIAV